MTDLHVRVPEKLLAEVDACADGRRPEFVRRSLEESVRRTKEQTSVEQLAMELREIRERLARLESPDA